MSTTKVLLLIIICTLTGTVGGGFAGYYAALSTPMPAQIAVVDVEALARGIDPRAPDYRARMHQVTMHTKMMTDLLTSNGVVVLDRAQVLGAPDDAVVSSGAEVPAAPSLSTPAQQR